MPFTRNGQSGHALLFVVRQLCQMKLDHYLIGCGAKLHMPCRSTAKADTQSKPNTSSNGAEPSVQSAGSDREARQAVAAKISAARALARKLSEEQQAAVTAAKLAAEQAMDESEIDRYRSQAFTHL